MAFIERGFSFRRHEGHMFFIYDHKKKKEEDDPKDAILYFYPRSVKTEDQIALVGGIIGITDFCLEFLPQEMPEIIKLSAHNFALLLHGDYIIGLAGTMDIPANFLVIHMQFLWSTFVFYQGSITALRQRQSEEQFLRKLNMVWDIYLPLCQSQGDLLGQAYQTIPYIKLHKSQGSLFLHASHILQRSLRQKGVLAGALFSKNKVLCTQLSNVLTRKLLLLMMQTQFPSVEVSPNQELPGGVHLINVYLTQNEYKILNHRRKKRYSSSLQSSVEEATTAKLSTSPDMKNSLFSDSAISSGGEQITPHLASMGGELCRNSNSGHNDFGESGQKYSSGEFGQMVTCTQKNVDISTSIVDCESYSNNDSGSKTLVTIDEAGSLSSQKPEHSGDTCNEFKHFENFESREKEDNSAESQQSSLNSSQSKANSPSISVSLESNSSSVDSPKQENLCSSMCSNDGLPPNNEERNSNSPNHNIENVSLIDDSRNCSPNNKSGKSSPNEESAKSSPSDKSGNFSSNDSSRNLSPNSQSENSSFTNNSGSVSPANNESLDGCDNKLKDNNNKISVTESQNVQNLTSEDNQSIGKDRIKQFNLESVNNNLLLNSSSKVCNSSIDNSSRVGQSNDNIVITESGHKPSINQLNCFKSESDSLQRNVSLEDSFIQQNSVSADDSSFHSSSCEMRKDEDESCKSSVVSLANSDVPSSNKDRLTFEYNDSENSDFGIVSPDSEFPPVLHGLSSLKEGDGEDANYGSFHSCPEGEGLTMREKHSEDDNGISRWTPHQDDLTEMNLYIQGHSDTLLVLLIEKEVTCSKSYIHTLWKSCLSHLAELDFEVKNVERHSKDESENIGALYQYMKYDSFSHDLCGSAIMPVTSLANEMVDSCIRMHKDFMAMPDLVDATYRSHTACSFGRRSLSSETYFQIGLPARGGINPGERTFHLEQTAEKCLVQDHRINLL